MVCFGIGFDAHTTRLIKTIQIYLYTYMIRLTKIQNLESSVEKIFSAQIFFGPLTAMKLDKREGASPKDVVVDAVDLVVEVGSAPEVIVDVTIGHVPGFEVMMIIFGDFASATFRCRLPTYRPSKCRHIKCRPLSPESIPLGCSFLVTIIPLGMQCLFRLV
jgi:hypothetical protein